MITKETVFILGAGASAPYGFPTGKRLRALICNTFSNEMRELAGNTGKRSAFFDRIEHEVNNLVEVFRKSSTRSIDLFLARNPRLSELGKQAIVLYILQAEKSSRFREKMESEKEDWYSHLYDKMTESLSGPNGYNQFSKNKVSFITFNYDRSLEHFLFQSLSNSFYFAPKEKIIEQIEKIPIFHVYGALAGGLAWNRPSLSYRADLTLALVIEISKKIRTIYETEEQAKERLDETLAQIGKAERVFFLGFGYAKENCDVLKLPYALRDVPAIYGTARGFFENEINKVKNMLAKGFDMDRPRLWDDGHPKIEPVDCVELLRRYL